MERSNYTLEDLQHGAPTQWVGELFKPLPNVTEFRRVLKQLHEFCQTKDGRKIKGDIRKKLHGFAYDKANRPDGTSYVDVMGTYTAGTHVKDIEDLVKRGKRYKGEQLYAEACVQGLNATLKDMAFVHKDDNNYATRAEALLAIEASSIGSKGPFDGSGEETALQTVDTVLSNAYGEPTIPENLIPALVEGLNRRIREYQRYVNVNFKADFGGYVDYVQQKGLKSTMRGFPFFEAGDKKLTAHKYNASLLMFRKVKGFKFKAEDVRLYAGKMTIDEFIQAVMVHLDQDLKLKMSDWYSLDHSLIVPISRDQGAAFKTKWKDGLLTIFKRGDRKYRLVTPISAFAQAWLIVCTEDIIKVAPKTEGRIGLEDPDTNVKRMNEFIQRAEKLNRVLISTDFSAYDSTLPGWMMQASSSATAKLYDDPVVKDAMHMCGVVACQKIMILPTYKSERGHPYSKYVYENLFWIKGDKSFSISKITEGMKYTGIRKNLKQSKDNFDYVARAFYIYAKYLPSGLIVTNLLGSDNTLLMARHLAPKALSIVRAKKGFYYEGID